MYVCASVYEQKQMWIRLLIWTAPYVAFLFFYNNVMQTNQNQVAYSHIRYTGFSFIDYINWHEMLSCIASLFYLTSENQGWFIHDPLLQKHSICYVFQPDWLLWKCVVYNPLRLNIIVFFKYFSPVQNTPDFQKHNETKCKLYIFCITH